MRTLTRRDFVASSAALAAGAAATSCLPTVGGRWAEDGGASCSWTEPKVTPGFPAEAGRVVKVYNYDILRHASPVTIDDNHVAPTLLALVRRITGEDDLAKAWARLLPGYQAGQVIGIKVNTLNAKVPTHPQIVRELVTSLKDHGGIQGSDLLVWDRRLDELAKAGFKESEIGCRVIGTDDDASSQGSGPGYEPDGICLGPEKGQVSRIVTRSGADGGIDHLINFAVLKNHLASGFTGVLKNHFGTFHNPGKFHDRVDATSGKVLERRFEQAIPTINALPEVAKKARLWLVDATIVVTKGDTDAAADTLMESIYGGLDPVALDVCCRGARDEKAAGAIQDTTSEGWLKACERIGLGSATVKDLDEEDITGSY